MCTSPIQIKNPYYSPRNYRAYLKGHGPDYDTLNELRGSYIDVPCGKCCECARKKQNEWFIRLYFHSKKYDPKNIAFVTLTYNPLFVPTTSEFVDADTGLLSDVTTLFKPHFQLFMKRFRLNWEILFNPGLNPRSSDDRKNPSFKICPVTYFACGEYGSHTFRSHLHCILFGVSPIDALRLSLDSWTIRSNTHYSNFTLSAQLNLDKHGKLKPNGTVKSVPLGRVYVSSKPAGYGSMRYVAKYCTKYKCKFKTESDILQLHELIDSLDCTDVEKTLLSDNIFYEYDHRLIDNFVPSFRLCSSGIGANITSYPEYSQLVLDTVTNSTVIHPYIPFYVRDKLSGETQLIEYSMPRYMREKYYPIDLLDKYAVNHFKHLEIEFKNNFLDYVNSVKKTQFTDYSEIIPLADFTDLLCSFQSSCDEDSSNRERKHLLSFLQDLSNDLSKTFED